MNEKRLQEIIKKHGEWLKTRFSVNVQGERADLSGADLSEACLNGADLKKADLSGADLKYADLRKADLREAYLRYADLSGVNIKYPIACPEKGEFIGFKKADYKIVELKITENAKRCSATGRKCRCSEAVVISITNLDGTETEVKTVKSSHDPDFIYEVGKTVKVDNFNVDRWNECSEGIHFFITRQEAVEY